MDDVDVASLVRLISKFESSPAFHHTLENGFDEGAVQEAEENVAAQLRSAQVEAVASSIKLCGGPVAALVEQAEALDGDLLTVQRSLEIYHDTLHSSVRKIRELRRQTNALHNTLNEKRQLRDALRAYVQGVLTTPDSVAALAHDLVNAEYLRHALELEKKLAFEADPVYSSFVSARESSAQTRRALALAMQRITQQLSNDFQALRGKQANIAVVQDQLLKTSYPLYAFLKSKRPREAASLRRDYVHYVEESYYAKFKVYLTALEALPRKVFGDASLVKGSNSHSAHRSNRPFGSLIDQFAGAASAFTSNAAGAVGGAIGARGSVGASGGTAENVPPAASPAGSAAAPPISPFALSGRESVLLQSVHEAQPLLPVCGPGESFFEEEIFRSHQKLLVDSATSEFLFILAFFYDVEQHPPPSPPVAAPAAPPPAGAAAVSLQSEVVIHDVTTGARSVAPLACGSRPPPCGYRPWPVAKVRALFEEVFSRSLELALSSVEAGCRACAQRDPVGLLLMALLNEGTWTRLRRFANPCLERYVNQVQYTCWSYFNEYIVRLAAELGGAGPKATGEEPPTVHPRAVAKRYAALAAALAQLLQLSRTQKTQVADGLETPLRKLADAVEAWLHAEARRVAEAATASGAGAAGGALAASRGAAGSSAAAAAAGSSAAAAAAAAGSSATAVAAGGPAAASGVSAKVAVFYLNNYEAILAVFAKRGLRNDAAARRFELAFDAQLESYVALQLAAYFGYLRAPRGAGAAGGAAAGGAAGGAGPFDGDGSAAEAAAAPLVRFATTWRAAVAQLRAQALQDFASLAVGVETVKRVLTQMVVDYSECVAAAKRAGRSDFPAVANAELLHEIGQFSR